MGMCMENKMRHSSALRVPAAALPTLAGTEPTEDGFIRC